MAYRPHGTARGAEVDPQNPRAFAYCDRCDSLTNHHRLQWQYDWRGPRLQNLRILVCDHCLDKPFEHRRPVNLPPDPTPIMNARPGGAAQQMAGGSALGFDPNVTPGPSGAGGGKYDFTDPDDSPLIVAIE